MSEPFDPTAPLPAPPDPWAGSSQPSLRDGPPWHMTDMIAAEPHLARRLLRRLVAPDPEAARLAAAVRDVVQAGQPVVATGCGTSEHGALGVVEILREALGADRDRVLSEQAFELALDPPSTGLVIGVSHEGGTAATNAALEAARTAGARTALITAAAGSPGAALADISVATGEMDQSWCHTVGYVSPLLVGAAVGAQVAGTTLHPDVVGDLLAAGATNERAADVAAVLAGLDHLIVVGSGADRVAGREMTLKIEEGAWIPTAYRDLETFLHGHLPGTGSRTGLVLLLTDRRGRDERIRRARQALAAAAAVGVTSAAILGEGADGQVSEELTPAGRLVVPDAPGLPAAVASLLASATALQLLTERIARARGTNPDPIRRDDPRYRAASDAAEG